MRLALVPIPRLLDVALGRREYVARIEVDETLLGWMVNENSPTGNHVVQPLRCGLARHQARHNERFLRHNELLREPHSAEPEGRAGQGCAEVSWMDQGQEGSCDAYADAKAALAMFWAEQGLTMHAAKCPHCPATWMGPFEGSLLIHLADHIAKYHDGQAVPEVNVPWTLEDLKILEGMRISPK